MEQKKLLKMVSAGAHRHFKEPDGTWIADRAVELYHGYCQEHQDDPPAVKQHTEGMIYGAVALYRAIQARGKSPEEALALTDEIFQELSEKGAEVIRKALKLPGLYRKVPGIFHSMVEKKYNAAAGFEIRYYDTGKGRARFDVTQCPYYRTCKEMGCPELTTVFCNTDDCCYGNMHPRLKWNRTSTIGRGGDCCDFDIAVVD